MIGIMVEGTQRSRSLGIVLTTLIAYRLWNVLRFSMATWRFSAVKSNDHDRCACYVLCGKAIVIQGNL